MFVRTLFAGLLAVLAALTPACPASAADLGEDYGASPYDDPRYAGIYRHPPPRYSRDDDDDDNDDDDDDDDDRRQARSDHAGDDDDRDDRYDRDERDDRYGSAGPRPYPYDRRDPYLAPMPRPPRFSEYGRDGAPACLPSWRIKRNLRTAGWRHFRDVSLRGTTAWVEATRARSGRTFILGVDHCTGVIVSKRPSFERTYGAYEPPRYRPRD